MNRNKHMPLNDDEIHAIDIIARYNFLLECCSKGLLSDEKCKNILTGFGQKNLEIIKYYNERLSDHVMDTERYLSSLKGLSK